MVIVTHEDGTNIVMLMSGSKNETLAMEQILALLKPEFKGNHCVLVPDEGRAHDVATVIRDLASIGDMAEEALAKAK